MKTLIPIISGLAVLITGCASAPERRPEEARGEPARGEQVATDRLSPEERETCDNVAWDSHSFTGTSRFRDAYRFNQCALTLSSAKRYDQGDLTGAIEEATKALEIRIPVSQFPGAQLVIEQVQGLAHAVRGSAYFRVRQYEKAVADASKAIELDPKARYYALRADAYRALGGHDDKALADARKAIELDPKLVPATASNAGWMR